MEIATIKSQQLTVKQQPLLNRIAKVGALTPIPFAKNVLNLVKIRDLDQVDINQGFAMLFTRISNLIGIKEEISAINKTDISEMIVMRFKGLSLEEIDYAFKLERYGAYDDKTGHFQLFNAEYVSTILLKYKKWLQKTRFENNIPLVLEQKKVIEISEEEKEKFVLEGLKNSFELYQTEGSFDGVGRLYLYEYLYDKNLLPKDKQTKDLVMKHAVKNIERKRKAALNKFEKAKFEIYTRKKENTSVVIVECKRISIVRFFDKFQSYEQLLNVLNV